MIMEIFLILNHLEYKLFVFWGFYNCCYFVFVVSIVAIHYRHCHTSSKAFPDLICF